MNSLSTRNGKESLYHLLKGSGRKPKKLNFSPVWDSDFTAEGALGSNGKNSSNESKNRKKGGAGAPLQGFTPTDYWISSNIEEIIACPLQPGNLKITKRACLKRYKASEKTSPESVEQANLFFYTVGQGLLRCKSCSIAGKFQ
jgi:hypothetical protein